MYDVLNLNWKNEYEWTNHEGTIIVKNPSAVDGGPSTLLANREKTITQLAANNLTVFWTVLAGKDLIWDTHHRNRNKKPQWVSASAAYALDGDKVCLLSSTAKLWEPGPTEIEKLSYTIKYEL